MDELVDHTDRIPFDDGAPVTAPAPKVDPVGVEPTIEPLSAARSADGTRTKVHTLPPPIPARARATMPPPIPTKRTPMAPAQPSIILSPSVVATLPLNGAPLPAPLPMRPSAVAPMAPLLGIAPIGTPSLGLATTVVAAPSIVVEQPPLLPPPLITPAPVVAQPPVAGPAWTPGAAPPSAFAPLQLDEEIAPTTYFARTEAPKAWDLRYVAAIGIGGIVVVSIIALALRGGDDTKSAAHVEVRHEASSAAAVHDESLPTAVAATHAEIAAPAVVAAPDATPRTRPVVEIPIRTWPAGATVTLVDNGTAKIIGQTPMTASVDARKSYDVVLAVSGGRTVVRHLDPATTHELSIDLDPVPAVAPKHAAPKHVAAAEPVTTPAPVVAPVVKPAPVAKPAPVVKPAPVAVAKPMPAKPAKTKPTNTELAIAAPVSDSPANTGTLQITTKPPCQILVDGKATGLTTPQAALALTPGAHAITLVNSHDNVKKTVAVHIEAHRATKLVQDFTTAQ